MSPTRPNIGVAFTGNGLRGFSNIALIEFFEEINFKPHMVVGCGAGSFIAALWGQGLNSQTIIKIIEEELKPNLLSHIDLYGFISFIKSPFGAYKKNHAILKPNNIKNVYHKLFQETQLEELSPRTLIQTTNVDNGAGVVFEKGKLKDLVYASGSMLPFFPPVCINDEWYTDGNFSAPVPATALIDRDMEHIISLTFTGHSFAHPRSFLSFYSNFVNLAFSKVQRSQIALAIELHYGEILLMPVKTRMKEGAITIKEIHHFIDAGRETVRKHKEAILHLINI